MSVRQFLIFLSLSALAFAAAIPNRQLLGAGVWILVYVAVNLLLVAIAYGGSGPAIFRKRVSGTIPWLVRIILAPYLLLNELAFQLFRLTSSEPPVGKAADNLYFGRRLTAPEAKRFAGEYGWQAVLDLAPEEAAQLSIVADPRRHGTNFSHAR
jgi:hypothetical protein